MRTPFVAGNWKMHKTLGEGWALMGELRARLRSEWKVTVAVCPPATLLIPMAKDIDGTSIRLGAQNVYCKPEGAFTGEISPRMLRDAGCTYVIIGHSERRQHFGEEHDLLAAKVRAALEAGLEVIYCIGETLEEREAGRTQNVVARQLEEVVTADLDASRLTLAYEPVWAIGTGRTATPEQAQEAHAFIRGKIGSIYDGARAESMVIQYGGSVKPGNAPALMACPDVDGALVGGACLVAKDFAAIIAAAAEAKQ
ncbi:MAG: triose-phosphate isomerase [Planctomycetota bacterium]|jgi:triosephosphate isomerase